MTDGMPLHTFVELLDEMEALLKGERNQRLLEISREIGKNGYHICIQNGEVYIGQRQPVLRYEK